jgi:hypothetical protein
MTASLPAALQCIGTVAASTAAAAIAVLDIDADQMEVLSRAPALIVLCAISAWLAWLLYKQGDGHRRAMSELARSIDRMADSHHKIAEELRSKPCLLSRREQLREFLGETHTDAYGGARP